MADDSGGRAPETRARLAARLLLVAFYTLAGVVHLARPQLFVPVVPDWVPLPYATVIVTGVCELAGSAGLLIARTRRLAAILLALYAVCVYPANIKHAWLDLHVHHSGLSAWYHVPRLLAQPLIVWWTLYAGGVRVLRRRGR